MARELIGAADEPVASLNGLMHMIPAWERGARRPSELYLLLYLRLFRPPVNGAGPDAAAALRDAAAFRRYEIGAMEAAALRADGGVHEAEIRAMAAALGLIQEQVAAIALRLAELTGGDLGGLP
jgi:hypothetical protein